MTKERKIFSPSGPGGTSERSEEFEQPTIGAKYSQADLDKIREIHALATRLFQALGLPWAHGFVAQQSPPVYHSGYTYSPAGREQEATPLYGWNAASGASPYLYPPLSQPILSQQPMYVAGYAAWSPLSGMPWQ